MGLGDFLIKKTAKSTAKSIAKYVNGGAFGDDVEALKAWASTRRNGGQLIMSIEDMVNFNVGLPIELKVADLACLMFYCEMDLDSNRLSSKTRNDIEEIFSNTL